MKRQLIDNVLVLLGAIIGGVIGIFIFSWLVGRGFYGLAIPGGLVGIGAGIYRTDTKVTPFICGFIALFLGLFAEWHVRPFITDGSFGYFLSHIHQLQGITIIMLLVGTAVGFWIPFRRTMDKRDKPGTEAQTQ